MLPRFKGQNLKNTTTKLSSTKVNVPKSTVSFLFLVAGYITGHWSTLGSVRLEAKMRPYSFCSCSLCISKGGYSPLQPDIVPLEALVITKGLCFLF